MADHYIGINRGKQGTQDNDFAYGTSTGSTDIEVRIADAAGWSILEVEIALEQIKLFLINHNVHITATQFPPAT